MVKHRRLLAYGFALVALGLLPWAGWLSVTLPSRHLTHHWGAAWVGFDAGELTMLAATAWALWRRAWWVETVAAIAGTLLVCDAWFDNLLSASDEHLSWVAVLLAFTSELPLAALCFWVAIDTARFYVRLDTLRGR